MQLPRLATTTLATLAVGGALAGCGSDTAAIPVPGAADSAVTKTQAVAYAKAINLRATDLPRMNTSSPEHEGKAPTRLELALARCDGEQDPLQRVLNRVSPTFTSPSEDGCEGEHEEIHSSIEVLPTPAIAAKHNAAQISPRGLDCIGRLFPAAIAKRDKRRLRYGPVTLQHLPYPLPGVPGSFAVRIATSVLGIPSQIAATPPHVYIDILGFLAGASEINLTATGFPRTRQRRSRATPPHSALHPRTGEQALSSQRSPNVSSIW
jgi:hypothetical protein